MTGHIDYEMMTVECFLSDLEVGDYVMNQRIECSDSYYFTMVYVEADTTQRRQSNEF